MSATDPIYYTVDGLLLEVASDRYVRNYGIKGGFLRVVLVRDAARDETETCVYDKCERCMSYVGSDLWWRLGNDRAERSRQVHPTLAKAA